MKLREEKQKSNKIPFVSKIKYNTPNIKGIII